MHKIYIQIPFILLKKSIDFIFQLIYEVILWQTLVNLHSRDLGILFLK